MPEKIQGTITDVLRVRNMLIITQKGAQTLYLGLYAIANSETSPANWPAGHSRQTVYPDNDLWLTQEVKRPDGETWIYLIYKRPVGDNSFIMRELHAALAHLGATREIPNCLAIPVS